VTDNSRCVILVPAGRSIEPHCDFSLRQLEAQGYTVRRLYGFAQIDVARNRLAAEAIADGFEELMWIDSDIAFEPRSVQRLRLHGLPIVAGLYPKKIEKAWASQFLPDQRTLTLGEGGGLIEVLYAAAGFLLVRRQVFLDVQRHEQLPACSWEGGPATTPFFLPMVITSGGAHIYLGEDFAFCERARRCGFKIIVDTTIRLQHIGIYGYSWEDVGGGLPRYPSYEVRLPGDDPPSRA
jgi:hypothetical protein